jgi:hypothetical protein
MDRITGERFGSFFCSDGVQPVVEGGARMAFVGEFDEAAVSFGEGSLTENDGSLEIFEGGGASRHGFLSRSDF